MTPLAAWVCVVALGSVMGVSAVDEPYMLPVLTPAERLKVRPVELSYAAHHTFYDRKHKLVYCAVPKVACTEFMRLIFRLREGNKSKGRWKTDPHFRSDKPLFSNLAPEEATDIMNDPTWTKFVFFRDPAKRALSAFLDKFGPGSRTAHVYSTRFFKRNKVNFSDFVDLITDANQQGKFPKGLHSRTNPHWRPQRFMCNMEKFLPVYNFVGDFAHLQEHTELLLKARGLWRDYGESGWSGPGARRGARRALLTRRASRAFADPSSARSRSARKPTRGVVGNMLTRSRGNATASVSSGGMFERNMATHKTAGKGGDLYTPALLERVRAAYAMDYEMLDAIGFGGPRPTSGASWEANGQNRDSMCKHDRSFCEPRRPSEK